MLSQVPLAYMYKAARLAGVPLTPYSELVERAKEDFLIDARLASAWNAYAIELGSNGALLKGHMALYYRWRAARLSSMLGTDSYKAADDQAQLNIREANDMLSGDLDALNSRRRPFEWQRNPRGVITNRPLPPSARPRMNKWHYDAAQIHKELDEWEVWALTFFDHPEPLSAEVMRFFDDYVHDSFAGFCLAGAVTEYDKRVVTDASMKKTAAQRGKFEQRVCDVAAETKRAQEKKSAGETLSHEEVRLVRESAYGTPFPIMSDADSAEMGSKAVEFLSNSRREGGGYIMRRGYYPHNGWIRVSVNEAELERAPDVARPKEDIGGAPPTTLIWSNDVAGDLLALDGSDPSALERLSNTA